MKQTIIIIAALMAASTFAEQYKIKFTATVDILEDGKVVGQKRLKPGTIVETVESEATAAVESAAQPAKSAPRGKLQPSKLSPIMFKNTRPAAGAVLRAEISLGKYYWGKFDGKENQYWNIDIDSKNDDWGYAEDFMGYVKKTTPIAKQLLAKLEDGKEHKCLVKLIPIADPDHKEFVSIEAVEFIDEE